MASVTENVRQLDSSKCRICMFAKPNLSPLFRRGLSMKVMKLAEIKMYEGDGLPSTICLDCEMEVNRCVNFIAQIQRADVKLREMLEKGKEFKDIFEREQEVGEQEVGEVDEQEASTSQIEIEEFNVKQEIYVDNFLDEVEDAHSESDHDHFGDGIENDEQAEDEIELNPLNHVDVVEDRKRAEGMDVSSDPLGQEEPIIESQNNESDPGLDPLNCMKQEAVSMDIDKDTHEASASTSSVSGSLTAMPFQICPQMLDKGEASESKMMLRNVILLNHNVHESFVGNDGDDCKFVDDFQLSTSKDLVTQSPTKSFSNEMVNKSLLDGYKINGDNESFCRVCNVNCHSVELFNEHKADNGFICRVCGADFISHAELENHFQRHYTLKCGKCKETVITKKELTLHWKEKHPHERFGCDVCTKTYTRYRSLRSHKLLEHSSISVSLECVVCGKRFNAWKLLDAHLKKSHIAYENIECKLCNSTSSLGPERMKLHMRMVHGDNIPARCQICGKVFKNESFLPQHLKTHDDSEKLCEICGKTIKGVIAMKNHVKIQHSRTGVFTCNFCNEQFSEEAALVTHKRRRHKKRYVPMPVFCEICGKQFKSTQVLKWHKTIHTNEKSFTCEICGASFKQDGTLRTHRRVHSNAGKYVCDDCGMSFKWKQTFDKHVKNCKVSDQDVK